MNVLSSRQQAVPQEVSDAGQLEPVEPTYMKPPPVSSIASRNRVPSEPTTWKAPVVSRAQNTVGMRYLYAHGGLKQPISELGTGKKLGIAVWSSNEQPVLVSMHDAGFNDALFQAGYPGYNLGLSFKVPTLQENATGGPGYNMRMTVIPRFLKVQKVSQPNASPGRYNTQSQPGGK